MASRAAERSSTDEPELQKPVTNSARSTEETDSNSSAPVADENSDRADACVLATDDAEDAGDDTEDADESKREGPGAQATATADRKLTICSWGQRCHDDPQADVTFDLIDFATEYDRRDIRNADGRDEAVQQTMRAHPDFDELIARVIRTIEGRPEVSTVAFACAWGKHRSMAWAEILKHDHYPRSRLRHARLLEEDRRGRGRGRKAARRAKGDRWS